MEPSTGPWWLKENTVDAFSFCKLLFCPFRTKISKVFKVITEIKKKKKKKNEAVEYA